MRQYWKLVRFTSSIIGRTIILSASLPFVSDKTRVRAEHQSRACRALCRILDLRISQSGSVPSDTGMLIASNHLGPVDPLVIASLCNVSFAGKAEILTWPLVGWICRTVGLIAVHRRRRMETNRLVESIRDRLSANVNVVVFPEGTTSSGKNVLPFKTGAFAAVENGSGFQVLPVCLSVNTIAAGNGINQDTELFAWTDGRSLKAYAFEFLSFSEIHLDVRFGDPISTVTNRKMLADLSYQAVAALHVSSSTNRENLESPAP